MEMLPTGTVTFLFTDIEGSTKLAQGHPDKWDALQQHHHAILHESAVEAHNGYVFQIIGDAFCAHVHVYVDNKEVGILRKLKGSYPLETLSSGKRNICVKVVNKAHVPVGIEQCVQVMVN